MTGVVFSPRHMAPICSYWRPRLNERQNTQTQLSPVQTLNKTSRRPERSPFSVSIIKTYYRLLTSNWYYILMNIMHQKCKRSKKKILQNCLWARILGDSIFFSIVRWRKSRNLTGFWILKILEGLTEDFEDFGIWFNFLYFLTYIENFRFQSVKSGNFEIVGFR